MKAQLLIHHTSHHGTEQEAPRQCDGRMSHGLTDALWGYIVGYDSQSDHPDRCRGQALQASSNYQDRKRRR